MPGRKASSRAPWDGGAQVPLGQAGALAGASRRRPCRTRRTSRRRSRSTTPACRRSATTSPRAATPRRAARPRWPRDPRRARLPAAPVPLADRQPAHRRLRRQPREPDALPARGLRGRARRVSRRQAGLGAHLGHRLGAGRLGHRRHGRAVARAAGARLRGDPRLERRRLAAAEDRRRPRLPGAVRAARQGRGRPADDRRRPDHRARAGRVDHRQRRGRRGLARPRDALRPALAVACGGPARRPGRSRRRSTGARSRASTRTCSTAPSSARADRPGSRHEREVALPVSPRPGAGPVPAPAAHRSRWVRLRARPARDDLRRRQPR